MKFDQAIQEYSPEIQEKLGEIFDEWSKQSPTLGLYIVTNIRQREKFLTKEAWTEFLNRILECEKTLTNDHKPKDFVRDYQKICLDIFDNTILFSNREVVNKDIYQTLGNAQDLTKFVKSFMKTNRNRRELNNNEEEIRNTIENAAENFSLGDKEQAFLELQDYSHLAIRQYTMWATWDLDFKSDNPFGFMLTNDPDEVRLCLALGEQRKISQCC